MFECLNLIDIKLFRFVNSSLSNPIFDWLMPLLTDLNKKPFVLVLFAALLLWMIIRGSSNFKIAALLLILAIIISDQLSSSVIKYWFERPRPCHSLHNVRLLVGCGSGFSFPSSHAVNNFAGALILTFMIPKYKWWFFGFAFIIAFSRVYVGVHYPSDVIGGGVIGLMCGSFVILFYLGFENIWLKLNHKKRINTPSK